MLIITTFSVGTRAIGFVYKIIISRILTNEMLGILNISLSAFGVIATIVCSGIAVTIAREVSINQIYSNNKKNNSLMFSGLTLTLVLTSLICLILIVFKNFFVNILSGHTTYLMLICMLPAMISNAIYTPFKSYMQGRELYFQSSLVEFIEQILRIIACFVVFIIFNNIDTIFAPIIAMSVAGIISTIIGIIFYKKLGGGLSFNCNQTIYLTKKSTPITLVKTLSTLVIPIITILIPIKLMDIGYSSEESLSLLGIATGMTLPLISIPGTIIGSLALALLPQISTLYENKNNNKIATQIQSSIKFTIITTMLLIPTFIILGKPICEIIFNNSYAGILLSKASWIMIPMGLNQITTSILNSLGKEKSTFISHTLSGIIMIICVLFLTKYIGVESIIWCIGLSSTFVCIYNICKIKNVLHIKTNTFSNLLISIISTIPVIVITKFVYNILSLISTNFVVIFISSIISIFCLGVLYLAFGVIDITQVKHLINFKKFKKNV